MKDKFMGMVNCRNCPYKNIISEEVKNNDDYHCNDYCHECQSNGDDYGYDEEGNYVCLCDKCFMNPFWNDDDD